MIRIIAGGKKNTGWELEACAEYEKRLKKPFDIKWEFYDDNKLVELLKKWPFDGHDLMILADERGENISSLELADKIEKNLTNGKNIIIIIGGAFGVPEDVRKKADFVWSFSKLVFPHLIARVIVTEQIYRAQEILRGGKYHHV